MLKTCQEDCTTSNMSFNQASNVISGKLLEQRTIKLTNIEAEFPAMLLLGALASYLQSNHRRKYSGIRNRLEKNAIRHAQTAIVLMRNSCDSQYILSSDFIFTFFMLNKNSLNIQASYMLINHILFIRFSFPIHIMILCNYQIPNIWPVTSDQNIPH